MDKASKDVLFMIAQDLELPSLLKWCSSNSRINSDVCNNDNVWRSKLLKDYPDYATFGLDRSLRETYIFLYQLSYIKKLLNTNENIYDIFLKKKLILSDRGLTKVPAFDLPNLEILDLSGNKLKTIPLFNLPQLQNLVLLDNELTEIPNFQFPNLKYLYLYNNRLAKIPTFHLPKLTFLDLHNNRLTELPEFDLPNLKYLSLYGNKFSSNELQKIKDKFRNKTQVYLKNR